MLTALSLTDKQLGAPTSCLRPRHLLSTYLQKPTNKSLTPKGKISFSFTSSNNLRTPNSSKTKQTDCNVMQQVRFSMEQYHNFQPPSTQDRSPLLRSTPPPKNIFTVPQCQFCVNYINYYSWFSGESMKRVTAQICMHVKLEIFPRSSSIHFDQ